jgi:hypothetical protein
LAEGREEEEREEESGDETEKDVSLSNFKMLRSHISTLVLLAVRAVSKRGAVTFCRSEVGTTTVPPEISTVFRVRVCVWLWKKEEKEKEKG